MQSIQEISNTSPFGVLFTDSRGAAAYVNPAFTQITGVSRDKSLGFGWLNAVLTKDRARVLSAWRQAAGPCESLELSCRITRPDGSRRYVRVRGRCLPDSAGEIARYMGVVVDITEQVTVERRLRKKNLLLSAILANIPCGVTVYDGNGSLLLENQQFRSLSCLPDESSDEAISDFGTPVLDIPTPKASWASSTEFDPAPRVREEPQPDGRVLEVREAAMPTGGLVTTYTDITQHKLVIETLRQAKAAAEQAAAAKAAFLAAMSHEIRTPMNGVMGMTNVLLESPLTADQREIVELVRDSGESLLVVLNDILDYSKVESGQLELEWKPFRLDEAVDRSVRLLGPKAQEKSVRIAVDIDPDVPAQVLGDRNRLQQILVNLISNAVKFTDTGEIRISVANPTAASGLHSGALTGELCSLSIEVRDSGIGIPHAKLDTIFEPFVQADSSTARRYGGTGLGLSIARRLVEAMGGSIGIESAVGEGTTVRFNFIAETAAPRFSGEGERHTSIWGKRALLLVGPRSDAGQLALQLKRWGVEHETCTSVSAAHAMLLADNEFDLIFCAMHSVGKHGVDFVRRVRASGVMVPALLLTQSRLSMAPHPSLMALVVPRTASESALYKAMVAALQPSSPICPQERGPNGQFDAMLGERKPLRILVAEDNEINLKVASRMLTAFGYECDIARNGRQAVEAVRQRRYELVLMDIQMPDLDGMEAIRMIVDTVPARQRPRIVAMSANVMHQDVQAALAAGADEYIGKPFPPDSLRGALERTAQATPSWQEQAGVDAAARLLSDQRLERHLRADGSGEFLHGLIVAFESTSADLLNSISEAIASSRLQELRTHLHEYSGMCAVMGAQGLVKAALKLEALATGGDLDQAADFVHQCTSLQRDTVTALWAAWRTHQATDGASGQETGS